MDSKASENRDSKTLRKLVEGGLIIQCPQFFKVLVGTDNLFREKTVKNPKKIRFQCSE